MKTLILQGSPRQNGDTAALVSALRADLVGEVRIIDLHSGIAPCVDCRYCWEHSGCAMQDPMQAVYDYLVDCDNVVLASPVWFSSLSGPMLNLCSRVQTYFAARHFRGETPALSEKRGLILLVGGNAGTERNPLQTATEILRCLRVPKDQIRSVCSMDTDRLPAAQDAMALEKIRQAADWLNRNN